MSAISACSDGLSVQLAVKHDAKIHLAFELPVPIRGQTVVPFCSHYTRQRRNFSLNRAYGYRAREGSPSEVTCTLCRNKLKP